MAEYRLIALREAPNDDGTQTGNWFYQYQKAESRDAHTGQLEWEDLGPPAGPVPEASLDPDVERVE